MAILRFGAFICTVTLISACASGPYPGPDKQFAGTLEGAITGAGAGAVTGFQVSAAAGPGAAIGAGMGALAGGVEGLAQDRAEDRLIELSAQTKKEREKSYAQEMLTEHFKKRAELHPSRDIYPADWFFCGDEVKLRAEADEIVRELANLHKQHRSWSRLVVAAYVKSVDAESTFARHLAESRSRTLVNYLVRAGLEPRRLQTRAVIIQQPLVIDPYDRADRYNQAIEIIALDR